MIDDRISHDEITDIRDDLFPRVVLDNVPFPVITSSGGVIESLTDPRFRNDQFSVSNSGRTNLEGTTLEFVLSIDFAKVSPSGGLRIACRDWL